MGTEIIDDGIDVHVTKYTEPTDHEIETSKKPKEGSRTDDDSDIEKSGPLQRKGGFRKSPSSSRKSSW